MKRYPLVFSFRDLIAGNGFAAVVSMDGRVLLVEEDDQDTWMFGVQPGGIAGGDPQRKLAFSEFKKSYLSVLFDISAEATSFEQFKGKVTAFFDEINASSVEDWQKALNDVRTNNVSVADLKRVPADARVPSLQIDIVAPERINSGVNEFDGFCEAA